MKVLRKDNLAFSASLLVAAIVTVLTAGVFYFSLRLFFWWFILLFIFIFFLIYFILYNLVERYIKNKISKIYRDVGLLDESDLFATPVITDMEMLTREVERYTKDKKLEIETLNIRENYRKDYMGNVAHELKTPLFTVQGYILTLLDGAMEDKEILKKYLEGAEKGVERLVHIVKDLDMITQLEVGELVLEKTDFDIVKLIRNIFNLLGMRAEKKNIKLTFDKEYKEPVMVNGDREKIEQVLINLIMNSLKYGKNNGTTEVAVEDFSASKVLVRVTDNGEGIPKESLSRIFERFFRIDKSGSRKQGGSGLGLSIVKHIVEAHFEKIYVESQLGVGSEFSFSLEKAEEPT